MIGYAHLLAEGAFGRFPSQAAEAVERIREQCRELLQLSDATLDVNRLESGSISVKVTEMPRTQLVDALAQQLASVA